VLDTQPSGNLSRFIISGHHDSSHGSANSKCRLGPAEATSANIGNTGRQLSCGAHYTKKLTFKTDGKLVPYVLAILYSTQYLAQTDRRRNRHREED